MAFQFLTQAALQQVTQRVLQQLPAVIAALPTSARTAQPQDLARLNAVAIDGLARDVQSLRSQLEATGTRIASLERERSWRSWAKRLGGGLIVYVLGFATAVIIRSLGWVGG